MVRRRTGMAAAALLWLASAPAMARDPEIGRMLHPGDTPLANSAVFRVAVGENGRAAGCAITQSSGDAAIDAAACRFLMRQRLYGRQRDAQGRPIAYEQALELFRAFVNRVQAERDARP